MKTLKYFIISILLVFLFNTCGDKDIDKTKPSIDLSYSEVFPQNCDTLYFGESFNMKMLFTDNVELGSYSMDIHNNFDHHAHSTEVSECDMDSVKTAVNPFTFIQDYDIPENSTSYKADISISLPSDKNGTRFDDGDYHFFISLTDNEGWSIQKGLSVKILHRE